MAYIELVIKIPEWQYKSICEGIEASKRCGVVGIDPNIHEAIYNGTPLPKGHGRLIDSDEFHHTLEDMPIRDNDKLFNWLQKACNRLAEAPTIIEADKAESEDKE